MSKLVSGFSAARRSEAEAGKLGVSFTSSMSGGLVLQLPPLTRY